MKTSDFFSKKNSSQVTIPLQLVQKHKSLILLLKGKKERFMVGKSIMLGILFTCTLVAGYITVINPFAPLKNQAQAASYNAFEGANYYVNPDSTSAKKYQELVASNDIESEKVKKIASTAQAIWFGEWNANIEQEVDITTTRIIQSGALPVYVAYNIPGRDCGQYSAGGAASPDLYMSWINSFVNGLKNRKAVLILEPDALGHFSCLSESDQNTRMSLLKYAVEKFSANHEVSVYIEASTWIKPELMSEYLKKSGIEMARGIAVNTSGFNWNSTNIAYVRQIRTILQLPVQGIIDTSRNGLGPSQNNEWCNPEGRALGNPPSTRTEDAIIDAYFWIKSPGESDGSCHGAPAAGQWFQNYALGLVERSPYFDEATQTPDVETTKTPNVLKNSVNTLIPTATSAPVHEPDSIIKIYAAGTSFNGIYPALELNINSTLVTTFTGIQGSIQKRNFVELVYKSKQRIQADQVSIRFSNDGSGNGEDRNLLIDKINIDGTDFETESSSTLSTGSWTDENGCGEGFKRSEYLHCNGTLYFQRPSSVIRIYAAGTAAQSVYPEMELWIHDTRVKTFSQVTGDPVSRVFNEYFYASSSTIAPDTVQVKFVNDAGTSQEDRNLYVDRINIDGIDYQSESPTTYSEGAWSTNTFRCEKGISQSELLSCNGFFKY